MTKHIICDIVFYIFLRYNMKDKLHDNIQDNFSNLDDEILDLNIDPVTQLNYNTTENTMQQYYKNISHFHQIQPYVVF